MLTHDTEVGNNTICLMSMFFRWLVITHQRCECVHLSQCLWAQFMQGHVFFHVKTLIGKSKMVKTESLGLEIAHEVAGGYVYRIHR